MPLQQPALLALADGTLFRGVSIGVVGQTVGEVVFNTAMTGYQEVLTDPSYHGQIVTFTYPHIGNTGSNPDDEESGRVYCAGMVIRNLSLVASNWRSRETLPDYLRRHRVVAIADIDTRSLTRLLRERGAQNGCIVAGDGIDEQAAIAAARALPSLEGRDLAREVSVARSYEWTQGTHSLRTSGVRQASSARFKVVAYDFGVKYNILRLLVDRGCSVTVVPAQTPAADVLAMHPDGVFLSNGPGDPGACDYAIASIRELLKTGTAMFGICLGHQLLALASGARTLKMKFGHHGANHPVLDIERKIVYITSQNHGFAVDEATLPANLKATHRSLFDGSLQGIARTDVPAFGFQGHPEDSPGPHDITMLFDRFVELMQSKKP
ncbi:MAG: glutamine-hydrolyzing carbamoyl-phosphate synthase small subunit [Chromatiales bacterium]|nr:glutamine-hydrolyzing carbamoyl-phosphate synthase small subunit [Chromatiales bacterium]